MTRIVPSAAAAVLAVLLAVGALAGPFLLSASLLVAVVALATGWPNLLGLPTQRGSTTVLSLCGAGAVLLVSLDPGDAGLSWLAAGLAMSVVATFAHQLLRRDMRPRLVESVTGVVSGVVVVELVAGWVAAGQQTPELVVTAAAAVVAVAGALALPWPQRVTGPFALVVGATFAALAAGILDDVAGAPAAVMGAVVAGVMASFDRLFTALPSATSRQAGVAIGAAQVCSSGAVVYLLARVLG